MDLEGIISRHDPEGVLDRTLVRAIVAEALQQQAAGLQDVPAAALPMEPLAEPTWSGFFKRTIPERQQQVATLWPDVDPAILNSGGLSVDNADSMVENCIGVLSLPLGLGLNFVINGEPIEAIPMAVEEPSVIAATSGAAKLVSAGGGFETATTANIMFGQIQLIGIGDGKPAAVEAAAAAITAAKSELVDEANIYCASMLARGGGVVDITPRLVVHREGSGLESPVAAGGLQLVVHVHIDVQASMGANLINTVVEGVSDTVFAIAAKAAPSDNARCGVRILSNMCSERRARASFRVPATELSYKGYSGAEVGRRIVETWRFAFDDPFRAVTHNKGVMNGIDAVAVATGQDWRALEAGAHAYSTAGLGRDAYLPLTSYSWHVPETGVEEDGWLEGVLEMPMACGTVGGAIHSHPTYQLCHTILGHPDASRLSEIIAAVGLAQNLAAIRAMATEGIQRGHMSLHARNVAVTALGGPDVVSSLNSGPRQGEGSRRLEMIASHLAESGKSVSVTSAKEFAKEQGWIEE